MKKFNVLMALNWYHPKIHLGISRYAGSHNWHLNTAMALNQNPLYGWQGDGVISQHGSKKINDFVKSMNLPTVWINEVICDDNQAIGQLAADYFHQLNFRHFAACPIGGVEQVSHRIGAYIEKLKTLGHDCTIFPINKCRDWGQRRKILRKALKNSSYPLAVFAADDNHAAEIIEICLNENIQVPEQVAVLGVRNDKLICEPLAVPLSSIENHLEMQGYKVAEYLDYKMRGLDTKKLSLEIEKPYVVTRRSTDVIAVRHPEVARALKFIQENFANPIGVEDVVDATAMSKRGLQYAIKQFTGRTINQELTRVRLDHAVKLLETTDHKLLRIAQLSGFNNIVSFQQAFKRRFNITPGEYRKSIL